MRRLQLEKVQALSKATENRGGEIKGQDGREAVLNLLSGDLTEIFRYVIT